MAQFFTIGHSDRSIEELLELLQEAEVTAVVDVRRLPGSKRYPCFNQDVLAATLESRGVAYRHETALTGRRPKQTEVDDQVNGFWTNRSFHNYADYALSEEFGEGLDRLRASDFERIAVLCSEAVWWRCHRRIIADHLLARGEFVTHILGRGSTAPATLTEGAFVHPDGRVTYPGPPG